MADFDYYRRRFDQESAAAETASCAHARAVHRDLAERYSAKLRLIEALSAGVPRARPAAAAPRPALG